MNLKSKSKFFYVVVVFAIVFSILITSIYVYKKIRNRVHGFDAVNTQQAYEIERLYEENSHLFYEIESLKSKIFYKKKIEKFDFSTSNQSISLLKINLPIISSGIIRKSNGFVEVYKKNIFFVSGYGDFFLVKKDNNNNYNITQIESNYKLDQNVFGNHSTFSKEYHGVRDIEIINNKIYLSYVREVRNKCYNISILSAEINNKYLNFEKFFTPEECTRSDFYYQKTGEQFDVVHTGGKIEDYKNNKILLSTGEWRIRSKAQKKNSILGKIISIDKLNNNNNYSVISMGHRNPQGLYYSKDDDIIISTEHGPKGGDEININLKPNAKNVKNYGWPISSYGEHYDHPDTIEVVKKSAPLKKSHSKFGFVEPLKYYTPAIAPTEIKKIPNNFNENFVNDYLVATLGYPLKNGGEYSLIQIRLDPENSNIVYHQTIDIQERIRDIDFLIEEKKIILSLESSGSIGILSFN